MHLIILCAALFVGAAPSPLTPLPLPGIDGGIGFDDLLYAPALGKLLVPAGRFGRLDLVDPRTQQIDSVDGFSTSAGAGKGHSEGTTSADYGRGFVFASDRTVGVVDIVDLTAKKIVESAKLKGGPDYVRWVEPLGELWVTEPNRQAIEYFKLEPGTPPKLISVGTIPAPDGPESLVVDATRGRAYTHTWKDKTLVVDLKSHRVVERWSNGCEGARGIALDEKRGLLFVGCDEGKAVTLDVAHGGKQVSTVKTGKGVDIIAFSPQLSHLYVPGGDDATLTIVSVATDGKLTDLSVMPTAPDAHCVAADDIGHAYVCDPGRGRLLVFRDAPSANDR